jgi:hypothetical protein
MTIRVHSDIEFHEGDDFDPVELIRDNKIKLSHNECLGGRVTWEGQPGMPADLALSAHA